MRSTSAGPDWLAQSISTGFESMGVFPTLPVVLSCCSIGCLRFEGSTVWIRRVSAHGKWFVLCEREFSGPVSWVLAGDARVGVSRGTCAPADILAGSRSTSQSSGWLEWLAQLTGIVDWSSEIPNCPLPAVLGHLPAGGTGCSERIDGSLRREVTAESFPPLVCSACDPVSVLLQPSLSGCGLERGRNSATGARRFLFLDGCVVCSGYSIILRGTRSSNNPDTTSLHCRDIVAKVLSRMKSATPGYSLAASRMPRSLRLVTMRSWLSPSNGTRCDHLRGC